MKLQNPIDLHNFQEHHPCKLADGTIRTLTRDFDSTEALIEWIRCKDTELSLTDVYWLTSMTEILTVIEFSDHLRYLTEFSIVIDSATDKILAEYTLEEASSCPKEPPHKDQRAEFSYLDTGKAGELKNKIKECPSCLQKEVVDKQVLCDARPDLSVFISDYPLHPVHAQMLRAILNNIEFINVGFLFDELLPYYLQAITCGEVFKLKGSTNYQERVEDTMEAMAETLKTDPQNCELPTVKEILSTPRLDLT